MEEAIWLTARGRYQEGRGGLCSCFGSPLAQRWCGEAWPIASSPSEAAKHKTHDVQLHLLLPFPFFLLFFGVGWGGGQLLGFKTRIWTCNGTQVGKPMQYKCLHACFLQNTLPVY